MNDNYEHFNDNIIYSIENLPGPDEKSQDYDEIISNFHTKLLCKCNCNFVCTYPTCCCLLTSGGDNYHKSETNGKQIFKLKNKDHEMGSFPVFECTDLCSCKSVCGNRVVQKGPISTLEVKDCLILIKQKGLFTNQFIHKDTFICEYAGEVITKNEAGKRHKYNKENGHMNYIFCLREHSQGRLIETFVDPKFIGNIGRYINHSCDPNTKIIPVRIDCPIPKLAVFSCKDISSGEELTFNYGPLSLSSPDDSKQTNCYCLSSNCSGVMPYQSY